MKYLHRAVLFTFVVGASSLAGEEGKQSQPVKADQHGDPLPPGAIARYGSTRFRHADAPYDMIWSPDGKLMVSYSVSPSIIHVWNAETGKEIRRFAATHSSVGYPTAVITHDNRLLAGKWWVWEIETGKEYLKLDGEFKAMSADGKRLACLAYRETHVWDLVNRKVLGKFAGAFVGLSRDGKRLTTTINDVSVVYDVDSGKELYQINGKCIAPGFGDIVVHSDTKSVQLWSTETGKKILDRPIATNQWDYYANLYPYHSFSEDGWVFAVLDQQDKAPQPVYVFDLKENKQRFKQDQSEGDSITQLRLSPDGKRAATVVYRAGGDAAVRLWDTATGKVQTMMTGNRVGFSPDGKYIATTHGHAIRLWDAVSGEKRHPNPGPYIPIRCLSFAPDGKTLIEDADEATEFRIWDVRTTKEIRNVRHDIRGWEKLAVMSPSADRLAVVQRAEISIRSFDPDKTVKREFDPQSTIPWIAGTPAGDQLACLELRNDKPDKRLDFPDLQPHFHFLDAATGKDLPDSQRPRWSHALQRLLPDPIGSHGAFLMATDFRIIAWRDGRKPVIELREIATGKSIPSPPEFEPYVNALAISPDSRYLAVGTYNVLRIWDIAAAKEVAAFEGGCGMITCAAFASDCRSVAAGYRDSTILRYPLPKPESISLKVGDLEGLWNDLVSADLAIAYRAIARLRGDRETTEKLLKERLFEVDKTMADRFAKSLTLLEDDQFSKREAAAADILQIGQRSIPALRAALKSSPSVDMRERIDKILKAMRHGVMSSEDARRLRALQILEQMGGALLEKLASGNEIWLTEEARESLDRVQRQRKIEAEDSRP